MSEWFWHEKLLGELMWLRRPPHPTLVLEKNINFSFFGGEGELVAGASLIRHSYSLWFALFVALFMLCCGCFFMVHVILSLPSFCPHFANGKMGAKGGQWQYHMNHAKMAAGGHKEGKKEGKPETVRMPLISENFAKPLNLFKLLRKVRVFSL